MHRDPERADVLVLDGEERQSLAAVRSLGRSGLRVGSIASSPRTPGLRSRWCATRDIVPDPSRSADAFVDAIVNTARVRRPRAVIPVHDASIAALRPRRSELDDYAPLALASEEALTIAVSKVRTSAIAESCGSRVPHGVVVSSPNDIRHAMSESGLPVVVKPDESWYRRGLAGVRVALRVARDQDTAVAAAEELWQLGATVMLQEIVPGRREAISVMRVDGTICARFAHITDRAFPPIGGSSVTRESIDLPDDTTGVAEAIVDACELDGYSEVEFRRDASGRPVFMEVNPRLSAAVEVAIRAGVDFPALLFAWTAGERIRPVRGYRAGVHMRWLGGDIRRLRSALAVPDQPDVESRRKEITHFVTDSFRRSGYDYLARDDLRPMFSALGKVMRDMPQEIRTTSRRWTHKARQRG